MVLQKNRTNEKYIYYIYKTHIFKIRNWLMHLWRLASLKSARWVNSLETQEEPMLQFKSKAI